MTAETYKIEREKRGTQSEVAKLLGSGRVTIAMRETGARRVTESAFMKLIALPLLDDAKPRRSRSERVTFAMLRRDIEKGWEKFWGKRGGAPEKSGMNGNGFIFGKQITKKE